MRHKDVHFIVNKLARKFGKLPKLTLSVPILEPYVSAFGPSKLLKVFAKIGYAGSWLANFRTGGWRVSGAAGQNPYLFLFLRVDNLSAAENDN